MNEQWQELKETITEMRDNNGTGTQQEVCKLLVNLMEVLEKQMQEPSGDLIRRQAVIDVIKSMSNANPSYWNKCDVVDREDLIDEISELPSVKQEQKTGHWIKSNIPNEKYVCSECGGGCWYYDYQADVVKSRFCPNCGAKMVEPQESEEAE